MKELIKRVLSQEFINKFYHLPKAILANLYYGSPARRLKVIGVTGTDGKTTTVNMIYQILKEAGKKVSMISTINAPGFHVTSPDPFVLQKFIRGAKGNGDEYLIMEVTSHSLDQYRFWGIKFDIGVITNITHEHLDYHKTFENYFNTKMKLLEDTKFAVINQGIQGVRGIRGKIITFGLNKGDFNQKEIRLKPRIPGDYNIENALAALAVAFILKINRRIAERALEKFNGLIGRMEEIKNNKGIKIFVDFAHTPNALEQALKTLRTSFGSGSKTTSGRLIAVFGSAGKRDVEKRSLMGEVAGKLADIVVVTAEDPRGELDIINKQITAGAQKNGKVLGKDLYVVGDRGRAIDFAINELAKKGDTVGIFGKGHERSMNLDGKKEIPWSDQETVKLLLSGSSQYKKSLAR